MATQPFHTYNASFTINDGKFNHQESSIKEHQESITHEYWQYFLNILSYGMLITSTLADSISIWIYTENTVKDHCQHNVWCSGELNIGFITVFKFIFGITFIWYVIYFGVKLCYSSKQNSIRNPPSSKGTYLGISTLIVLILSLLSAGFGIGDEGNRSLSWNLKADNTNWYYYIDKSLILTFELKPTSPLAEVSRWDDSLDFYDISATTIENYFYLNFEDTKAFLERYQCEVLIPTGDVSSIRVTGFSLGPIREHTIEVSLNTSTTSNPNCTPL